MVRVMELEWGLKRTSERVDSVGEEVEIIDKIRYRDIRYLLAYYIMWSV